MATKKPPKKPSKKKRKSPKQRMRDLREKFIPGSAGIVWPPPGESAGWARVPRSLPLIVRLLNDKELSGAKNLSGPYVDLMCSNMGEGIVDVSIAEERCYAAGLTHPKTWKERIKLLADLGFIRLFPKGRNALGYAVIMHPHLAVEALRAQNRVDDEWYRAYEQALEDHGATIPEARPTPFSVIEGGEDESASESS